MTRIRKIILFTFVPALVLIVIVTILFGRMLYLARGADESKQEIAKLVLEKCTYTSPMDMIYSDPDPMLGYVFMCKLGDSPEATPIVIPHSLILKVNPKWSP